MSAYDFELPSWADGSWDVLSLNDKDVPGLCKVSNIKRGPKYDKKEAKGQTRSKVTFQGWKSADAKLVIRLWRTSQEVAFDADVLPLLEPEPGKDQPKTLRVSHPALAKRKVGSILVEELEGPNVDDGGQWCEWIVDFFEQDEPKKQQGNPGPPGQTPCQQAKAQFDQYNAELQAAASKIGTGATPEENQRLMDAMIAAQDRAANQANIMAENGCNEASPGSNAAAGGTPDP